MKATVNRSSLLSVARLASDVSDPRSTVEIWTCVLIEATADQLTISATDGTTALRARVEAERTAHGSVAVSARRFYDAVKSLDGDKVAVSIDETNRITLVSAKAKIVVPGRSGGDFPKLPATEGTPLSSVDGGAFALSIRRTTFIVDPNDARVFCQGVWFDGVRFVALNNHRLARADVAGAAEVPPVMVPASSLTRVMAAFEKGDGCQVGVGGGYFVARTTNVEITAKLIEAKYPPWEAVIPTSPGVAKASREALLNAVRRAELMTTKDLASIKLSVDGTTATVQASHATIGDASSEVALDAPVKAVSVMANYRYLLDALTSIDTDDVEIGLTGAREPIVFRPSGTGAYMNLVMVMA